MPHRKLVTFCVPVMFVFANIINHSVNNTGFGIFYPSSNLECVGQGNSSVVEYLPSWVKFPEI